MAEAAAKVRKLKAEKADFEAVKRAVENFISIRTKVEEEEAASSRPGPAKLAPAATQAQAAAEPSETKPAAAQQAPEAKQIPAQEPEAKQTPAQEPETKQQTPAQVSEAKQQTPAEKPAEASAPAEPVAQTPTTGSGRGKKGARSPRDKRQ